MHYRLLVLVWGLWKSRRKFSRWRHRELAQVGPWMGPYVNGRDRWSLLLPLLASRKQDTTSFDAIGGEDIAGRWITGRRLGRCLFSSHRRLRSWGERHLVTPHKFRQSWLIGPRVSAAILPFSGRITILIWTLHFSRADFCRGARRGKHEMRVMRDVQVFQGLDWLREICQDGVVSQVGRW